MEPRIQYAKTEDGVNIGYATAGEGPALIFPNFPGFVDALSWTTLPPGSELIRRLRVTRYDPRGSGTSDRDVTDFSLAAMVRDLEAVAEALGESQLALVATVDTTPYAIKFAAEHPTLVTHLVLFDCYATPSDYQNAPFFEFDQQLIGQDWKLYTETFVRVNMRLEGAEARLVTELIYFFAT